MAIVPGHFSHISIGLLIFLCKKLSVESSVVTVVSVAVTLKHSFTHVPERSTWVVYHNRHLRLTWPYQIWT